MAVADNEAKGFDNPAYAGEGQDELATVDEGDGPLPKHSQLQQEAVWVTEERPAILHSSTDAQHCH